MSLSVYFNGLLELIRWNMREMHTQQPVANASSHQQLETLLELRSLRVLGYWCVLHIAAIISMLPQLSPSLYISYIAVGLRFIHFYLDKQYLCALLPAYLHISGSLLIPVALGRCRLHNTISMPCLPYGSLHRLHRKCVPKSKMHRSEANSAARRLWHNVAWRMEPSNPTHLP